MAELLVHQTLKGAFVNSEPIDVWDVETFDQELMELLEGSATLIGQYQLEEDEIVRAHDLGLGGSRSILRPTNQFTSRFLFLTEAVGRVMQERTIRAFHYTRLTDGEVTALKLEGVHLSTPESLRARLSARVAAGDITTEMAAALHAASPLQNGQMKLRSGKFYMASHPLPVDDGGVRPLLARWGGEVAAMWVRDPAMSALLSRIGQPRVVEVAVPLATTAHSYSAAEAVVAAFGRTLGCEPGKRGFDLHTTAPLPPASVLAVHSEGERCFAELGRGYPGSFVDADAARWTLLNGENADDRE